MSEPMGSSPLQQSPPPGGALPFYQVWLNAVTKPNEQTYKEIASDPTASMGKGLLWVFLVSLVVYALAFTLQAGMMGASALLGGGDVGEAGLGAGSTLLTGICFAPVAAGLQIGVMMLVLAITNAVARALGGTGVYDRLVYTVCAYQAPLGLVAGLLSVIPIVGYAASLLGFYGLFLNILSVRVVHNLDWGKAAIASLAVSLGIVCLIAVCVIGVLTLLGPAISNVFEEIILNI